MTLLAPHALWWFAAVPLIVWLALPPRPRAVVWTPHLAEWQKAWLSLRRRPRQHAGLRLALLLVACAAAVLATADPVTIARDGPDRLVVLLDGSASMAAQDAEQRTAFERACTTLRGELARVPEHVDVTLLRCGGPLLRRHGASARTLHDVGEPRGALHADLDALAKAALRDGRTAVWTATDGQGDAHVPVNGALTFVGAPNDNVAIVAVRTIDRWPLPSLSLSIDVTAFTRAAVDGELRVTGAITAPIVRALHLEPDAPQSLAIDVERVAAGGELEVRIAFPRDGMAADDRWLVRLPPLPAPRIAVLADAEAGPFVHAAADALAAEVGGVVVEGGAGDRVGLVLTDGGSAPIAPGQVRAICFGTRWSESASVEPWLEPRVADWDRTNALTTGLDLSELVVQTAFPGTLPAGEPFLWALDAAGGRVPLGVVVASANTASIHFAFRLQDGNLGLLAAFPQLLRRAFVRAHGTAATATVLTPPPVVAESDLRRITATADRPLPPFGSVPVPLAVPFLLVGLLALVVRTFLRS